MPPTMHFLSQLERSLLKKSSYGRRKNVNWIALNYHWYCSKVHCSWFLHNSPGSLCKSWICHAQCLHSRLSVLDVPCGISRRYDRVTRVVRRCRVAILFPHLWSSHPSFCNPFLDTGFCEVSSLFLSHLHRPWTCSGCQKKLKTTITLNTTGETYMYIWQRMMWHAWFVVSSGITNLECEQWSTPCVHIPLISTCDYELSRHLMLIVRQLSASTFYGSNHSSTRFLGHIEDLLVPHPGCHIMSTFWSVCSGMSQQYSRAQHVFISAFFSNLI